MEFTRCLRCMEEARGYPCPHCGYDPATAKAADYGLRPGTILSGKYVVGTVLGQGGFGITYVGWDLALDCKVAIKEYYPSSQVVRDNTASNTLRWFSTPQSEAARDMGKEMFLKEARKMTRVRNIPQVVHVHDLFQENDTAYIVMDFVEGQTLKTHLAKNGPLSWEAAKSIFFPVIRSMEQVHKAGLVHRDLSPDNLMIADDGTVQILDLGAAKDLNINSGASSMQVAKGGFSPLEQYSQRGSSGPWTDVYALAATMYCALTGVLPPNAVDRVDGDPIRWDLPQLANLPKGVLSAIQQAMAVSAKARTQSMGEFLAQLDTPAPGPTPTPEPKPASKHEPTPTPEKKKRSPLVPVIAAVLVFALVAGWALWPGRASTAKQKTTFPLSIQEQSQEQTICCGNMHTVAIKNDGRVLSAGNNVDGQRDVSGWTNIVTVAAGSRHTIGLRDDGAVVAVGKNSYGQCDVSDWTDIVAIAGGGHHTVGLKADGTVVATGRNDDGECNVSSWRNIVAISAGSYHTIGLKADGTVVAAGSNSNRQCNISGWTDIVAISAGHIHTVGLKADGTAVTTGNNQYGQCDTSGWTDIVAIGTGRYHTVGLKANGKVVSTRVANYLFADSGQADIANWTDIVAICAGTSHTIGLKADGTAVATGLNSSDQCDVSTWTDIRIPRTTK